MNRHLALVVAAALASPFAALACDGDSHAAQLTVDDVAKLTASKELTAVDANGPETRAKYGTVPGAVLLSGHDYVPAKELPADKATRLVFYCANVRCTSAPSAAKRAVEAGYTRVSVMPDGIQGWVKAGKAVNKVAATTGASPTKS
jgi:rhodanese-related sulfurtransferase